MATKKNKNSRRSKSNLIAIAAVAVGVYILMKDRQAVISPIKPSPSQLPGKQPAQSAAVGTRLNRQRYINTYI